MTEVNELQARILAAADGVLEESLHELFKQVIIQTRELAPQLTKDLSNDEIQHLIINLIAARKLKLLKFYGLE